jgi:hypothetical protein
MQSLRGLMRGQLLPATISLILGLSSALVLPVTSARVSAASYTGYAQGQVMATYDSISYPAMAAPKLKPSVALAAYKGPLLVHANPDQAAVHSGLGDEWQCVELVQRYFYGKGWTTVAIWSGVKSAYQMPAHIPATSKGPEAIFEPQSKHVAPMPGDILVFSQKLVDYPNTTALDPTKSWPDGHVALITGVSSTRVTFIQQNIATVGPNGGPVPLDQLKLTRTGSGSTATYSIGSESVRPSGVTYSTVAGWIHAVNNTKKAPAAPVLVPAAPDAPTNLLALGTGPGTILLTWSPSSVAGDSNQIVIVSSPGVHTSSDPGVSVHGGTTATFTWSGLTVGQRYCFDIRAVNVNGSSAWAAPGDAGCATADAPTSEHGPIMTGVVTLTSTQELPSSYYSTPAFDMDTGQTFFDGNGGLGDFYFDADPTQGGPEFWANNVTVGALTDGSTGTISGTIFDATNAPAANILVYACAGTCTHTTSAGDGTYSIGGLAAGSYRVGIEDLSGRLPGGYASSTGLTTDSAAATLVVVGVPPEVQDVHAPAGQRISGTVTASVGGPIKGALVVACAANSGLVIDQGFLPCGFDVTAADGTYSLTVLPSSTVVYAMDLAYTHASGYYATSGYVFAEHLATPLAVGTTDIAGIDLALPPGAAIAGTVTDSTGAPVASVEATACLTSDLRGCLSSTTEADGSYTIEGLPAGSYDVTFVDPTANHPTGFYGAAGFAADSGQAKAVVLGASGASGIDAQLPDGRVISGRVVDASGAPVRVEIEDCTSVLCVPVASTGADGSYRLSAAAGRHTIHVSDNSGANLSGYYSTAGLANGLHATTLTVSLRDLTGISMRLHGIAAAIHPGLTHTGSFVTSTVVAKGTYATARFTFGKPFAGTRVTVQRATKSSAGTWSTYRSVATVVVAADGNAYYSVKASGYLGFRALESDGLVPGVQVLSAPAYVRGK